MSYDIHITIITYTRQVRELLRAAADKAVAEAAAAAAQAAAEAAAASAAEPSQQQVAGSLDPAPAGIDAATAMAGAWRFDSVTCVYIRLVL